MSERKEFRLEIPGHHLDKVATDAVLEIETGRAKEAIVYSLEHLGLVEVKAIGLKESWKYDRKFRVVTDDRFRRPRDYGYPAISRALFSVLNYQRKEVKKSLRTTLINLKAGESFKILRGSR